MERATAASCCREHQGLKDGLWLFSALPCLAPSVVRDEQNFSAEHGGYNHLLGTWNWIGDLAPAITVCMVLGKLLKRFQPQVPQVSIRGQVYLLETIVGD